MLPPDPRPVLFLKVGIAQIEQCLDVSRRSFSDDLEMINGPIEIILAEKNLAQHEVGTQVGRVNLQGPFELVDRLRDIALRGQTVTQIVPDLVAELGLSFRDSR